jgi:aspartyl-tRNA(Asn)/glutamyl-tRNA(Gln) amidotransferase subunit B
VHLNRIHIEEDAGKSIHLPDESDTLVDFNRAGVPLIEIVTEPDMHTPEEAYAFLTEIRRLVKYLDICDGNMEEGSLRCDANISIMPTGSRELGKKVEVKNMNSIRNVQRAIKHEIARQITMAENGETIFSETRTFDAATGTTAGMRTKEELNDYRYFPDPDLSVLHISQEWLDKIGATLPDLPRELYRKYVDELGLPELDAQVITDSREVAEYFEEIIAQTDNIKAASNWVMGPVKSYLNENNLHISDFPVTARRLANLIELVDSGKVSFTIAAQQLFPVMARATDKSPEQIAETLGLYHHDDDDTVHSLIEEVLGDFPDKVDAYKKGQKGLHGMFMGEIMKRGKGKVNPKVANELLSKKLG